MSSSRWARWDWPVLLALAGYLALGVMAAYVIIWTPFSAHVQDVAVSTSQVFATLLAAASLRSAGNQSLDRPRWAWWLMACGWLSWGMGQAWVVATHQGVAPSVPSIADIGFLAVIPLMLMGVVGLAGFKSPAAWFRLSIEAWAIAIALIGVTWHFVLLPIYLHSESPVAGQIVSSIYPLGDLVILYALAAVFRLHDQGRARIVLWLYGLGLGTFLAADLAHAYGAVSGVLRAEPVVDLAWFCGPLIAAFAGLLQRRWKPAAADADDARFPGALRLALPMIVVPVSFGLVMWLGLSGDLSSDIPLVIMSTLVVCLILIRQAAATWENVRLNHQLVDARDQLEVRVEERTREVLNAETKFGLLSESAAEGIITADGFGRLLSVNPAARRMFGFTTNDFIGKPLRGLLPAPLRNEFVSRMTAVVSEEYPSAAEAMEARAYRADGSDFPIEISLSSWETAGERFLGAIIRDISERKRYEEQLKYHAEVDALTGLLNRRRLEYELERELGHARRSGASGALLFMDLDRFKGINDNLGHRSGDHLLISVANLLKDLFGADAVLARLGGDEFAILIPGADNEGVGRYAEALVSGIRQNTILAYGQEVSLTASVGIAMYPLHATAPQELLVCADQAMYQAKERRDKFCMYASAESGQSLSFRRPWEQRIREGFEHDLFVFEYQPICDLDGNIKQYEALIRLRGEDGELIPPGSFMEVAERSGLVHSIDRWVVRESIARIAEYQAAGETLRLEVNLSAMALNDAELLRLIESELERTGIDPANLVFEVTETAAIADLEQARRFIAELKEYGCRFALDDFGVGFSSFYMLKQLPVDYLKIDGSFVRDMDTDLEDQHLVRAIAQMAAALGKQTIAEFVTHAAAIPLLREFGVNYAQGYLYGRPGPLPPLAKRATSPVGDRLFARQSPQRMKAKDEAAA